jgi:hypothetical protein
MAHCSYWNVIDNRVNFAGVAKSWDRTRTRLPETLAVNPDHGFTQSNGI